MKRLVQASLFGLVLLLIGTGFIFARDFSKENPDLVVGAQLYDKWYAVLGVEAPLGEMPIWSRQSTNSRSGPDTWRCSECHGWDYKGNTGAYASGSHYTGFPSLIITTQNMTEADIVGHLKGDKDPAHNFSKYLDDNSMQQLAVFLKNGLIDDSQYIDSTSLKVIGGDLEHGKELFQSTCAECHGEDGKKIIFRTEGIDEYLGSVANRDPYRFLHRTRFGVAGTEMPIGYDLGWSQTDGRDVLMYAQTLPTGSAVAEPGPGGAGSEPSPLLGGPASNLWTGILTGIVAMLGTLGGSLVIFSILIVIGATAVLVLRRRK